MLLHQHSAQEEVAEEENILMMSQHCIGGCMSDVHTADAGGTTGQLALLRDSILVSALPPSTGYFEEGAKNYSVLTHNHFIKQVSQTEGQR